MDRLLVVRLGLIPYEEGARVQAEVERRRLAGEIPDVVLMLEHPPVYTKGRRSSSEELPMGEDWYRMQGIEVVQTDRGGQVTYHGPGQLVAYPVMSLRELNRANPAAPGREAEEAAGIGVHEYVRLMEDAIIAAIGDYDIEAGLIDGLTGVWVGSDPPPAGDARKIGSIGIHVHKGITTHGLAVNVANDLQPFEWVVPCGIEACRMTSLTRELGSEQSVGGFADALAGRLGEAYGREPVEAPADAVLGSLSLSA